MSINERKDILEILEMFLEPKVLFPLHHRRLYTILYLQYTDFLRYLQVTFPLVDADEDEMYDALMRLQEEFRVHKNYPKAQKIMIRLTDIDSIPEGIPPEQPDDILERICTYEYHMHSDQQYEF